MDISQSYLIQVFIFTSVMFTIWSLGKMRGALRIMNHVYDYYDDNNDNIGKVKLINYLEERRNI